MQAVPQAGSICLSYVVMWLADFGCQQLSKMSVIPDHVFVTEVPASMP